MSRPKEDMGLSEFMEHCEASEVRTGLWAVSLRLREKGNPDGLPATGTVENCYSEYEAKERVFLYLRALIYEKD